MAIGLIDAITVLVAAALEDRRLPSVLAGHGVEFDRLPKGAGVRIG